MVNEAQAHSMAHVAEELLRAGGPAHLDWHGARLTTDFQPIFCVRRGRCLGYEALVRARIDESLHSHGDVFERTPSERRTTLDWACRALHLRNFARVDPGDRTLFLNVHPQAAASDVQRSGELAKLIRYYGLLPRRVCVEVLESECADEALLGAAIATYRAMGVLVAVDDFGVGQSNFDRVAALRPDIVKIDRSILTDTVQGGARGGRLLARMIELLHQTGARVAIEGIESVEEARLGLEANADLLQGYFFAVPHPELLDETGAAGRLSSLLAARPAAAARRSQPTAL
jgi:EAL domain-containing protein (putative c-di-GMP-specific phosphodiesterase class I)